MELAETVTGFTGNLLGVAGGWYPLEVRRQGETGEEILATVPHVGIGEVFICVGASLVGNSNWPPQIPQDERVVSFNGNTWRPGYDPQPLATNVGGSPWPILGECWLARCKCPSVLPP